VLLALVGSQPGVPPPQPPVLNLPAGLLQPGDVVFLGRQDGVWAQLGAMFSGPGAAYGHVGLVVAMEGGEATIVHADGSPLAGDTPVTREGVSAFLADADSVGVYRPSPALAPGMVAAAEAMHASGLTFDPKFELTAGPLEPEAQIYCSELIWRAMSLALGRDAVPHKTVWMGRVGIALADLETHPDLTNIWQQAT
jgi:uncharacterized protein YycO